MQKTPPDTLPVTKRLRRWLREQRLVCADLVRIAHDIELAERGLAGDACSTVEWLALHDDAWRAAVARARAAAEES